MAKVENLDHSVQSIVKAMGADSTGNSRNGNRSESTFQRRQEMSLIYWSAVRILVFQRIKSCWKPGKWWIKSFSCADRKSVQVHDVFWLGTE